ncbi:ATP-binding cassette sub-family B member 8, mitochondrial [Tetranychus urticae]|uniref:Mitochondrial potassium channel ATP-binding subunit n=1 Tax=Tetranychus urticae TaxID=32264 RepID=T1KPW9_TETUR|nr:ATP-binding cassette sub-family B member 8, mitochondrial [Tetranychus urticae]
MLILKLVRSHGTNNFLSLSRSWHPNVSSVFKSLKNVRFGQNIKTHGRKVGLASGLIAFSGYQIYNLVHVKCEVGHHGDSDITEIISPKDEPAFSKENEHKHFRWSRIWAFIKNDYILLFISIASALCVAVLNIKIPLALGSIINDLSKYIQGTNQWSITELIGEIKNPVYTLITLYLLQSLGTFINISTLSIIGERMALNLRIKLFRCILDQDVEFFDKNSTGDIISRLTTDVQDFKSSFKLIISQGIRSITQVIGSAVSLYSLSSKMTLTLGLVLPAMVSVGRIFGYYLKRLSDECQKQIAKATEVANEAIGDIRTVKAFSLEDREFESFSNEMALTNQMNTALGIGIGMFRGVTNLALNQLVLGTLMMGGYLVSIGDVTPGSLMSFLVASQTVQRSLAQLSLLIGQYIRACSAGERIFEFIDSKHKIPAIGGMILSNPSGDIQFNNVKFSYPTRPGQEVLKQLNLNLKPGTVTAICGLSGSGKSTIAALIERFYDVDEGSIKIDGTDIRQMNCRWLRGQLIGYINQEPTLFATTIRENIRFGKPGASDEEVYEAAKLANADEFIKQFPDGYDTQVGERGLAVSGGQKQRIAIARAILKNPTILILDEATSALDASAEKSIQQALETVMKGKTVMIIAHRLSTIQNADIIVVIAKGKIIETGSHQELIKKKGFYYNLIMQQAQAYES